MSPKVRDAVFFAVIGILIALAVWTLVPGNTKKVNDLGYHSTCPFVPWSTLALLAGAGVAWMIRQYAFTKED